MRRAVFYIMILSFVFIFMSNRSGRGNVSGNGATTAPGETGQFCGSVGCHLGNSFNTMVNLSLIDVNGNETAQYIPGDDYTVIIDIDHTGNPAGYGFQIVSLQDSDDTGINNFSNFPAQTSDVLINERQYVEHNDRLGSPTIELSWTAPEAGTGDITFYAAGNAVNGNGGTSGDTADTTRFSIREEIVSSTSSFVQNLELNVYPNPTQDFITVESDQRINNVVIYDLQGKMVRTMDDTHADVSDLLSGLYILRARSEEGTSSTVNLIKY